MFRLPVKQAAPAPAPEPWVRPADWLEIDSLVNVGDEKFVGLHLITEDSNFLALSATSDYTVDWGDGLVENFASGIVAYHSHDWVDFVGTDSVKGYRQAIVTVTPQVAGTFTNINLQRKHNQPGLSPYSGGWIDIVMSAPNMTSIDIGDTTIFLTYLEKFVFKGDHLITNMTSMFEGCSSLQSVPLFNTASVTNMTSMFKDCSSLQSVPLFNTASVTKMTSMFEGCSSLQSVPLFNTASVTNMTSMFKNCSYLQSVPLFDTSLAPNMSSMFEGCSSLQSVPLFNTASVTSMSYMFKNCSSLQSVPLFNTASVVYMSHTFRNCPSLLSVPLFDISSVAAISYAFYQSPSIQKGALAGTKTTISYSGCKLSANALTDIFNGLATIAGQTITITGNWGTPLLTAGEKLIATDKGWTIVE
jgi:surface protein